MHELGHAEWVENNPFGQNFLGVLNDPAFDNFEEYRVEQLTNLVARELGEPLLHSHHADAYVESANVTDNNRGRCTGNYSPETQFSIEPYQATTLKARSLFYFSTVRALPLISPTMVALASRVFSEHDALVHKIRTRQSAGIPIDDLQQEWEIHRDHAVHVAESFKRTLDLTAACPFPTKLHTRG